MTLPISPYLLPYLTTADQLPDQLPDVPEAVVQALQARIRKLVQLVAVRDEEIRQLERQTDHSFQPSAHVPISCAICGEERRFHTFEQLQKIADEADAQLIAAAPDLLAALKEAVKYTHTTPTLREQCEAAIAKAEGVATEAVK